MSIDINEIAFRIKDLREFSDLTTAYMGERLGLSQEEYEQYETGEKDFPIGLLYNIARVLDIDPSVIIFGKESTNTHATVVYEGKGKEITRYDGYSFISLNADFADRSLEPMIVTIKEGVKPELVQHPGQEFNYVLEGQLRVIVGEREYYLKTTDSIYFNAMLPHAQVSMSGDAKFLTIIQK